MTVVEQGSRWLIWGTVRIATSREESRLGIRGPWVLMIPEGRAKGKPHFTDWIEERRIDKYGHQLQPGEEYVAPVRRPAEEVAAEKARKRKVMTPERRIANRITSTRYKIKHPEKHSRDAWTKAEIAEMTAAIDASVEELQALREQAPKKELA